MEVFNKAKSFILNAIKPTLLYIVDIRKFKNVKKSTLGWRYGVHILLVYMLHVRTVLKI